MPSGVMEPGQEPAESEFSFGPGMVPNPGRSLAGVKGIEANRLTRHDMVHQKWAEMRTDPTDSGSTANYDDLGNPDRYGGQPALVRESAVLPPPEIDPLAPGGVIGAVPKTGVTRES